MHLGLVTPEWHHEDSPGGIATYTRILARQVADLGHRVTVFAAARTAHDPITPAPRIQVISIPVQGLSSWIRAERFRDRIRSFVNQGNRLDCIEAADYWGCAALLDASTPLITRLHTPLTLLVEGSDAIQYPQCREVCALEEKQVRDSVLVTSPSHWMAEEVMRLWGLAVRPPVIPNPIDALPALDDPGPRTTARLRVLYFGHLAYHKGITFLAEALRQWFDHGADAEVSFISQESAGKGEAELWMRRTLGRYAESERCRFLPEQRGDLLRRSIAAADLVVLPSLAENFGYAILEAMSHGKPVIATTGSGTGDIITNGHNGFLVPPGDVNALVAALAEVSTDRAELRAVGLRARESLSRFSIEHTTARLIDTYLGAAAPSGCPAATNCSSYDIATDWKFEDQSDGKASVPGKGVAVEST